MKHLLFALILTTTAAQASPPAKWAENPGPHTIKRSQPGCQNISDYDQIQLYLANSDNKLEQARARPLYESLTDPDNPRNGGRLCLPLKKGMQVMVEKRSGTYECVRFKGMPIANKPWEDKCFWAKGVSRNPNLPVPGADFYWLE